MTTTILDFEIAAFLFGAVLCLYLRSIAEHAGKQRAFHQYCLFITLGCAADVISGFAGSRPLPHGLHTALEIAMQTCAVFAAYWYVVYLLHFCGGSGPGERNLRRAYKAGLALYLLLQLVNLATCLSGHGAGGHAAGPLDALTGRLYPALYLLSGLLHALSRRRALEPEQRQGMVVIFGLTAFVYAFYAAQLTLFPHIPVVFFLGCVSAYALFFTLETPAFRQLETLVERLRESNREAEEAKERAARANAAKGEFLATMSHEIRTPMTTILGMNEVILRREPEGPVREYAADIRAAGDTLVHIVNDILDFSKIEAGEIRLEEKPYHFGQVLREVNTMIGIRAEQAGLRYEPRWDGEIVEYLEGDALRVTQILTNLLNNAVKYTREGGVKLEVGGEFLPAEGEAPAVQRLVCTVTDTGIGIREEDIPRLFQTYSRVDAHENRNVEGTGLGLAITARLVGLLGGTIRVASEYGKGSVFRVELPQKVHREWRLADYYADGPHGVEKAAPAAQPDFTAPGAALLVVDDNRMNRVVVAALLEGKRLRLDEAADGEAALALARDRAYDLILMDYMMPGLNGLETLRRLRAMPEAKSAGAKVVVCTANAITGVREELLAGGFDDYISKPLKGEELTAVLRKWLPPEKIVTTREDA